MPKKLLVTLCLFLSLTCGLGGRTSAAENVSAETVETIGQRYRQWVLTRPSVDFTSRHIAERYELLKRQSQRTIGILDKNVDFGRPAQLYDTRRAGAGQKEVDFLIKYGLPQLAIAYQLPGPKDDANPYYHDKDILRLLIASFDQLHRRGFREGMLMP